MPKQQTLADDLRRNNTAFVDDINKRPREDRTRWAMEIGQLNLLLTDEELNDYQGKRPSNTNNPADRAGQSPADRAQLRPHTTERSPNAAFR